MASVLKALKGGLGGWIKNATGTYGAANLKFMRKYGRRYVPGLTKTIEHAVVKKHGVVGNVISTFRRGEALGSAVASGNLERAVEQGAALVGEVRHGVNDLRGGWSAAQGAAKSLKRAGTSLQGEVKRRRKLSGDALLEMKELAGGA